jgi:UDP-N-acetylmuramoylalanine--D-glutamate ligase
MPIEKCGTLEVAVASALRDAKADGRQGCGDPALSGLCHRFDQYPNFEVRGDAFVKAVAALPGVQMTIEGDSHAART